MTGLEYIELAAMRTSQRLRQDLNEGASEAFAAFAEEIYRLVAELRQARLREERK